MKAIIYSTRHMEQQLLELANNKKHDLRFVSSALNLSTVDLARDCDAVVVSSNDDVSTPVVGKLGEFGIKIIATRSVGIDHIDINEAERQAIAIANVPSYSPQAIAEHAVALTLALARKIIPTVNQVHNFDFRVDNHLGFNLHGKTVGIIGYGRIGQAAAEIFKGFGCRVIATDLVRQTAAAGVEMLSFDELLAQSDVISLHVPFNALTHYLINKHTIGKMKTGVMLINTSRGGVLDTRSVIDAIIDGKVGSLGMDVYEFERGLFFQDHQNEVIKDALLLQLMSFPNVLITPHQASYTVEAIREIARETIENLDRYAPVRPPESFKSAAHPQSS